MSPRSPKRWSRPRSRAHREAHCGVPRGVLGKLSVEILKRLYASGPTPPEPEMTLPAWAVTARKFGWITRLEAAVVDLIPTGRMRPARPGLSELIFAKSPILGLMPKRADWGGGTSPMKT